MLIIFISYITIFASDDDDDDGDVYDDVCAADDDNDDDDDDDNDDDADDDVCQCTKWLSLKYIRVRVRSFPVSFWFEMWNAVCYTIYVIDQTAQKHSHQCNKDMFIMLL